MNLALDYDDTYTRDPIFWNGVIDLAQSRGHKVYCITARSKYYANKVYDDLGKLLGKDACMFTDGLAKKSFAYAQGVSIDVWIDDCPFFVDNSVKVDDNVIRLWS